MDLPEDKGTYVLIASVPQVKRIEIGRLGRFDIIPGYYAYAGSGFGSGGLRARLGHHLESTADPHWHIDYLLQVAQSIGEPAQLPKLVSKFFKHLGKTQSMICTERHSSGGVDREVARSYLVPIEGFTPKSARLPFELCVR